MARRGRKPGEPTLKNGVYYAWHPTMKRKIPLNTNDFDEAMKLQQGFYQVEEMTPVEVATAVVTNQETNEDNSNAKSILDAWTTKTADATSNENGTSLPGLQSPSTTSAPRVPSPDTRENVIHLTSTPIETRKLAPQAPPKVSKGLTPDQTIKLAKGMKQMVTQLNMVIVGAGVSIFRTEIEKPDQDTLDILEMGIELQLEKWFRKSNPEPWMIILGANLIMAVSMWTSGKPRLKAKKPMVPPSVGDGITPIRPAG